MVALNKCIFQKNRVICRQQVLRFQIAFGSHCSANFQPTSDCFIPNFKLKHEDSESIKADRIYIVVSTSYQTKQRKVVSGTPSSVIPASLEHVSLFRYTVY